MKIALDTNRYRDFCDGDTEVLGFVQRADLICMPFITLAELRSGFAVGTKGRRNEAVLVTFLNRSRVRTLFPDEETILCCAELYRQLRSLGTPIPVSDLWIAALVVQHGLVLATRDAHFDNLKQIPRL